jgi:hypothetical protein
LDPRVAPGSYREYTTSDLEDFSIVVPTKKSGDAITAASILFGPVSASAGLAAAVPEVRDHD